jgi:tetratricopeptide (TPR) repeat protein
MTRWLISFGQLFELLRPAAYALAALVSAGVLADALRRRLHPVAAAAWTLAALALPAVTLPLYLLARLFSKRAAPAPPPSRPRAFALASAYALAALGLGAIYFVRDHRSADAHLARAADARLHNRRERAVEEYRAALRLEDDPHTRKLLGLELLSVARHAEALAELRASLAGGEPDELLQHHIAVALDALGRRAEADASYGAFAASALCRQTPPDARCAHAKTRSGLRP